jgi:hypothetical protein
VIIVVASDHALGGELAGAVVVMWRRWWGRVLRCCYVPDSKVGWCMQACLTSPGCVNASTMLLMSSKQAVRASSPMARTAAPRRPARKVRKVPC